MKKILLSIILSVGIANFSGVEASNINININIGTQPAWGPVGYDYAPYYYMPDINVYYNVDRQIFYYSDRGRWRSSRYLPSMYRHYDLYGLYKVVLNDPRPWLYNQHHMVHYRQYRGRKPQPMIRYSNDKRYRKSRKNDVRWYDDRGKNNGRSTNGRDRDYNNGRSSSNRPDNRSNNRPDNRQSTRSTNSRNDNRKNEGRSNMNNRNSQQRQSSDKNRNRSSSPRSDNGRSSSSERGFKTI